MSNEVKLNNLKTMKQEVLAKIDNLVKSLEKLKEYESLPEGKKRDGKEKDYSLKLAELVSLKEELNKLDSDIKTVETNVKEEEKARKSKEAERAKKTKKAEKKKTSKKVVKKEKGNAATIVIASVGVVALAATLFTMGRCSAKKNTSCNTNTKTNSCGAVTVTPTPAVKNNNGEEVELVVTPTPAPILVDVTNEEDVRKAAERIYNEDLLPILEVKPQLKEDATIENIEDMIRVFNGELPINSKYNQDTVNNFTTLYMRIFDYQDNGENLKNVNNAHFFREKSIAARLVSEFDEVKTRMFAAIDNKDVAKFIKAYGEYGAKLYNKVLKLGIGGGLSLNDVPDSEKFGVILLILQGASRAIEFEQQIQASNPEFVVCTETCYNTESKKKEEVPVSDIIRAVSFGKGLDGTILTYVDQNGKMWIFWDYANEMLNNILLEKSEAQVKALK